MKRYGDEELLEIVEAVKLRRKSQSRPLITLCARSELLEPMKEDRTTSSAESAVLRTNKGWSSDAENRQIAAAAPGDIYVKRLREWALDFKIAHAPIRALLAISKPIVHQQPADPRTLLGAAYDLKVAPMGSGEYVHVGLEKQLRLISQFPLEHQLRSGSEFRNINVQLLDNGFRKQLTSLHVNFKGRKTKERLSGSKLYEVILEKLPQILGAESIDRLYRSDGVCGL
ncbi:hypothetical protein SprV_0602152700 [Sparganum proliferum]